MNPRKIAVIIPVTQHKLAQDLMKMLDTSPMRPGLFIILDDSYKDFNPPDVWTAMVLLRSDRENWVGINGLWNWGVSLVPDDFEFVSIMNDDITIHPFFMSMVVKAFDANPKAGVVCPQLVEDIRLVGGSECPVCSPMTKREGGAFTFRKSVLDKIPPIPSELKVYFGDDWYFLETYKLGYNWVKIENSFIFHHGSLGNTERNHRHYLEKEREIFFKLTGKRSGRVAHGG